MKCPRLIAILIFVNLLADAACWPLAAGRVFPSPALILGYALAFSQVSLLAIWTALSTTTVWLRLPMLAGGYLLALPSLSLLHDNQGGWFILLGVQVGVVLLPLFLARFAQVGRIPGKLQPSTFRFQFRLRTFCGTKEIRMSNSHKPGHRRQWIILGASLSILVVLAARPTWHLLRTSFGDRNEIEALSPGFMDDASRLNRTEVADIWPVPADPQEAEQQLQQLLDRAKRDGMRVSIAGARHSMGGHTIIPGGIVLDMLPFHQMKLDEKAGILHVQSGARWSEIIPYLDQRERSVAVMQSNDSFSVGGSISVNARPQILLAQPIAQRERRTVRQSQCRDD